MDSILINLAVEDALSEAVLRAILRQSNRPYEVNFCYCQQGYGYLKKTFVEHYWNVNVAMNNSPSLQRAVNAVSTFQPI